MQFIVWVALGEGVAVGLLLGLWAAWADRKRRLLTHVEVQVDAAQRQVFQLVAAKSSLSLGDWAIKTLAMTCSLDVAKLAEPVNGMDEAYASLDRQDEDLGLVVKETPHLTLTPADLTTHSCLHLAFNEDVSPGAVIGQGQCRVQGGKQCFWPSQSAPSCGLFVPRVQRKSL